MNPKSRFSTAPLHEGGGELNGHHRSARSTPAPDARGDQHETSKAQRDWQADMERRGDGDGEVNPGPKRHRREALGSARV